jgi:imidazoleglycerol-phosphate dehydratase
MTKRTATISRSTKETQIVLTLNLDGKGVSKINTGIGFFDHMLEAFAKHGCFDLTIKAKGDLMVDQHHTVEDIGIVLGEAFAKALGDKKGINRTGYFVFPMDEALSICAADLSGRPFLEYRMKVAKEKIGDFETINLPNFFAGFVNGARLNLHLVLAYGKDPHHKVEACFKAFGKAIRMACSLDQSMKGIIPSTKGVL